MAGFARVNGDFKQVANYDSPTYTNTGVNAVTSGVTVQPQGPKLQFATVTFTGVGTPTGSDLDIAVKTIQQLATIYMYQFTEVGANTDTLALAMYPTNGWDVANAGALDAALTAALGYAVTTAAGATFAG